MLRTWDGPPRASPRVSADYPPVVGLHLRRSSLLCHYQHLLLLGGLTSLSSLFGVQACDVHLAASLPEATLKELDRASYANLVPVLVLRVQRITAAQLMASVRRFGPRSRT